MKYFLVALLLLTAVLLYWAIFHYYLPHRPDPWYYDLILHTLAGMWLGGAALMFLQSRHVKLSGNFWVYLILILGIVALAGLLWEFYEYETNIYAHVMPDPVDDTLSDLFADLVGGLILAVPAIFYHSDKSK